MKDLNNSLVETLAAIINPIVTEAVRAAINPNLFALVNECLQTQPFLTTKQGAETSGLDASTIRLLIRKLQLRAQKVGRRVLVKRTDLEIFWDPTR